MKRFLGLTLASIVLLSAPACMTFTHTVGSGPQLRQKVEEAQWFILWGLVPLGGAKDSKNMASGAVNYRVQTEYTFADVVITFFTSIVSIHKQTITVER